MKVGDIYLTKNFGDVVITSYVNCDQVGFRFTITGYTGTTSAGNIRKGLVKDRLQPSRYGVGYLGLVDTNLIFRENKLQHTLLGALRESGHDHHYSKDATYKSSIRAWLVKFGYAESDGEWNKSLRKLLTLLMIKFKIDLY